MENRLVAAMGQGPGVTQVSSFVVMGQLRILILVVVTQIKHKDRTVQNYTYSHTMTHECLLKMMKAE